MTARNYTFTWFDDTLNDIEIEDENAAAPWTPPDNVFKFVFYQLEEAPDTHRRHLQGFCCYQKPVRFGRVQEDLPAGSHIEKMRGTVKQSIDYCSKQASKLAGPWHFGEEPAQGKRTDFEDLIEKTKAGETEKDIIEAHPGLLRYPGAVKKAQSLFRPRVPSRVSFDDLRGWQQTFVDHLLHEDVKPRRIFWVWSLDYGTGKSTVCQYLISNHSAMRGIHDSLSNTMYLFSEDRHKIICFDCPRVLVPNEMDKFMEMLETLSDTGYVVSSKYEAVEKYVCCHIIVFSNSVPPDRLRDRVEEVVATSINECDL